MSATPVQMLEPIPGLGPELELVVHRWFRLPPRLQLPGRWGVAPQARGQLSVLDLGFGPSARLSCARLTLQLEGHPGAVPALSEVLVDEAGQELTGPAERRRAQQGLRQRVLFVFLEPPQAASTALVRWGEHAFARVHRLNEAPALELLPAQSIELLGLGPLGTVDDATVRWALLVRVVHPAEPPGLGPAAARLVDGGWEAQPGKALELTPESTLRELGDATGPALTVLFLYDTGPDFTPGKVFLRDDPGGDRPLPSGDAIDRLPSAVRAAAMAATVVHSGVP